MKDRTTRPTGIAMLVAIASLTGCDETVTTAPEEPPRERVVESNPASVEGNIHIIETEWTILYPDNGLQVVIYRVGQG